MPYENCTQCKGVHWIGEIECEFCLKTIKEIKLIKENRKRSVKIEILCFMSCLITIALYLGILAIAPLSEKVAESNQRIKNLSDITQT